MGSVLVPVVVHGNRKTGELPHVNHLYVRYRSPELDQQWELAGKTVLARVCRHDLRTLLPLDEPAVLQCARHTGRVLLLHEATRTGGLAGELAARICESAFEWLDAPVVRVTAPDTPVPYSPTLEEAFLPSAETVLHAARRLAAY